jgi:carbamoyl-phosphate synthase large subunit
MISRQTQSPRHFLTLSDLSLAEHEGLLLRAVELKAARKAGREHQTLQGKTLVLVFEKASTRTRVSFEAGMLQLGGHVITLPGSESQIARGEPVQDTARVLSRYADGIMIRTFGDDRLNAFAAAATVPVINGLSDGAHPVQLLADVLTIHERFGSLKGLPVAFVGDGATNMGRSWIEAARIFGFELRLAAPEGYRPKASELHAGVKLTADPKEAVRGALVVNTDVWTSMGQEAETAIRKAAFAGYMVDDALMALADPKAIVLHCLPAHRGEEIAESVLEGPQSAVWDEAENRLHAQKALLELLLVTARTGRLTRMPKREDIRKVLVIGSGPIVIGQACEFDYSGTQAIKALREEGICVVLLNSNPATIMTDPDLADRTYIEPMTVEVVEKILAIEKPDSLLPTMGGQTALNLSKTLAERGILERHGVKLLGASLEAIDEAEDRGRFKAAMERIGVPMPKSGQASTVAEALALGDAIGYPAIVRPSFTLGGTGGGIAQDRDDLARIAGEGLDASPTSTVLVEESVLGWKEYELEVVRDAADNAIIVCAIENLDPMGVHTGDSITVAPAMTLTDREYQRMRDAAIAILREIGVDTGGSNVQFGVNPKDGRLVVIEMNPRVSRSSALASKATGYPIAKIAAKLAIGYTLPELANDITKDTSAAFEPTLDYVVVKIPRFAFEKFPDAQTTLTTSMRSVGEVMAIGRTFREAYMKALRSLDHGRLPLDPPTTPSGERLSDDALRADIRRPHPERHAFVAEGFRRGLTLEEIHELSAIDPYFLANIQALVDEAEALRGRPLASIAVDELRTIKGHGFCDAELAKLLGVTEPEVRAHRHALGVRPVFKRVDTCAAELEAKTPYLYSSYEDEDEAPPTDREKIIILGSGPIRIGQGIEFDYACCHAAFALRDAGYETILINCNPETVSTDYDTSDRLYFEPLTLEDVLAICDREKPLGVIVQLGGQTPLRIADALAKAGVPILGTSPDAIDRAEDRERFAAVLEGLQIRQPENGVARSAEEAQVVAARIGYPVMVRPSYVLGGRAMEVVGSEAQLARYTREAVKASPEHPVLIDRFLSDAVEVDIDLIADKTGAVLLGGVLEHVEQAGVHSGDAACLYPPQTLSKTVLAEIVRISTAITQSLGVVGLMNVQLAVQGDQVFVLEANPRASRTVPFLSKATGRPLAKIAARVMAGATIAELDLPPLVVTGHVAVKESVFPFSRFAGVDVVLGPEMKSTGEVMGIDADASLAFAKSQIAAGSPLAFTGCALLALGPKDTEKALDLARALQSQGFGVAATGTTADALGKAGLAFFTPADPVADLRRGRFAFLVSTASRDTDAPLRKAALAARIPCFTTLEAARLVQRATARLGHGELSVKALQDYLSPAAAGALA